MKNEVRISIYNVVLNYILNLGLQDYDDFSRRFTDEIIRNFSAGNYDLKSIIKRMKTPFFRLNSLKRSQFLSKDLERRILNAWRMSSAIPPSEVHKICKKIIPNAKCKQVFVEEIDSFERVREVDSAQVKSMIPLDLEEKYIKECLAEIIGEPFVQKDWGGEFSDLFTTRIKLKGRRVSAAFMLKGRGLRKKLTIADCGKNGDQILRLVKEPAILYVVQHVNEIDQGVIEFLRIAVENKSRGSSETLYYCVLDGVDTARILLAYGKIKPDLA